MAAAVGEMTPFAPRPAAGRRVKCWGPALTGLPPKWRASVLHPGHAERLAAHAARVAEDELRIKGRPVGQTHEDRLAGARRRAAAGRRAITKQGG